MCACKYSYVSQMWVRQWGPAGRDFSTQDSIIGAMLLKYWNISELQSFIDKFIKALRQINRGRHVYCTPRMVSVEEGGCKYISATENLFAYHYK